MKNFIICVLAVLLLGVGVNASKITKAQVPKLKIKYSGNAVSIIEENGILKVDTIGSNIITVDKNRYVLKEIDFYTPSKNLINGKQFPLEAQFVHIDKNKKRAIISILFKEGEKNYALEKILYQLPKKKNKRYSLIEMFNPAVLFPKKFDYRIYNDSFGVLIIFNPVEISKEQIEQLKARIILK